MSDMQIDLFGGEKKHADVVKEIETQSGICTRDAQCTAGPDEHEPDCPKEQELLDTFGF